MALKEAQFCFTLLHLFQTNTTNPLTYLLTYRSRLTDINIIIQLYLEYYFLEYLHFLILSLKCVLITLIVRIA